MTRDTSYKPGERPTPRDPFRPGARLAAPRKPYVWSAHPGERPQSAQSSNHWANLYGKRGTRMTLGG